jgi:hypothetical protein
MPDSFLRNETQDCVNTVPFTSLDLETDVNADRMLREFNVRRLRRRS